jgi:katanin p80 WD40 repeat-containing subunit B1
VNCLQIGRKSSGVMVTGGEDKRVNLFAVGKPAAILSMAGHQSAVECVTFDSNEEVVVAGAAGGTLKLWDLEQAKAVRTLVGHRSNCQSVDFHPFGEFFASGSLDTNLKVWDVRRKGCIHTYKGHDRGVGVCKFSPDGKWVVSGGQDGRTRLWDLAAGRCLKEFAPHDGAVTSVEFHPNELLLATGSADRVVKLWDLETFEQVDECVEATGIKALRFAPDGSALLTGTGEFLKTWRWEPAQCHDAVDVSWKNLKDLSVHNNKLLGASISNSFVGVWVVDLNRVEPFHSGAERGPGGGGTRDAEREERSRRGPEESAAAAVAAAAEASRAREKTREEQQHRVLLEANGSRSNRDVSVVVQTGAAESSAPFDPRRGVLRDRREEKNAHRAPMSMNARFAAAHGIAEDPLERCDENHRVDVYVSTAPSRERREERRAFAGPSARDVEDEDIPEEIVPDDAPGVSVDGGGDGERESRASPQDHLDCLDPSARDSLEKPDPAASSFDEGGESDGEDDGNAFERGDDQTHARLLAAEPEPEPAESRASPTKPRAYDARRTASHRSPSRKSFAADAFDLETLRSAALEADTEFVDANANEQIFYAPEEAAGGVVPAESAARAAAGDARGGDGSRARRARAGRDSSPRPWRPVASRSSTERMFDETRARRLLARSRPGRRWAWTWLRSSPARASREGRRRRPSRTSPRFCLRWAARTARRARRFSGPGSRRSARCPGAGPKATSEARRRRSPPPTTSRRRATCWRRRWRRRTAGSPGTAP